MLNLRVILLLLMQHKYLKRHSSSTDPVEAGKEVAKTLRAEGASEVIEKVKADMDA